MKILILGDSHSKFFNVTNELKDCFPNFRGVSTQVISLSGATINGFGKRNSTLDSQQKFIEHYNEFKPDYICFALGQVDIELGFYYKTIVQNKGIDVDFFIDDLIGSYIESVKKFSESVNFPLKNIVLKGINLSTLSESRNKAVAYTSRIITENLVDKEEQKLYGQILKESFPTNSERNMNHLNFNAQLKKISCENDISYFDINEEILNDFTGNIRKEFLPASNDHHLVDSLFTRELHIQKLLLSVLKVK